MVLYNGGRAGGGVMQSDVYDGYAPEMGHGDSSWGVFIWGWGAAVSGGGSLLHLLRIMALDWWGEGLHLEMGDRHHLGSGVAAAVGYVFMT